MELESWLAGLREHLRLRTLPFPSQCEVYSLLLLGETPAGKVLYLFFIVCRGADSRKQLTLQLNVGHFPVSLLGVVHINCRKLWLVPIIFSILPNDSKLCVVLGLWFSVILKI